MAILLTWELSFIAILAHLINQAENAASTEYQYKKIVGKTQSLFNNFSDAASSSSDFYYHCGGAGQHDFAVVYFKARDNWIRDLATLKELTKKDPVFSARVKIIESLGKESISILSNNVTMGEQGRVVDALNGWKNNWDLLRNNNHKLQSELLAFNEDQQRLLATFPLAQEKTRMQERNIVLIGLAVNFAVAIGLALFFTRAITNRLLFITANTERLANNEELNPRLPGNDEIAKLDHSFHDMADALRELEAIKESFIATVSHDLRTPLHSLMMFLDLINQGILGELNETGKNRTQVAKRSIARLVDLINDLLDLEKLRCGELSLNKQSVNLSDVVRQSIDSVKSFAESHKVALESGNIDATVDADPSRLVQILVNLISNAVKFSPENSTVLVSASPIENFVELQVKDQGRGVPEELQEAIFDRFKQVKTSDATEKGGSGLGLAICRSLVEQHGGTIGVRSKNGEGSTFWFRIPVLQHGSEPSI